MADPSAKIIASVPAAALAAINDVNTRTVLQALIDGWQVRNGNSGSGENAFLSRADLKLDSVGMLIAKAITAPIGAAVQNNQSPLVQLVRDLRASVLTSPLYEALSSRVDILVAPAGTAGSLLNEVSLRQNSDNVLVSAVNTLWGVIGNNTALAVAGSSVTVNDVTATATAFSQVQATITDPATGLYIQSAALRTEQTATASLVTGLSGQYTVKLDLNGYIAGFGISSSVSLAGVATSSFIVLASRFAVVLPGNSPRVPFVVGQVNGQTLVGIDGSLVVDQSIVAGAIDTRMLTIKDAGGTVILSSGVPLTQNYVNLGIAGGNLIANSAPGNSQSLTYLATSGIGFRSVDLIRPDLRAYTPLRASGGIYFNLMRSDGYTLPPAGNVDVYINQANPVPVRGSTRYEASAYLSAHRCTAWLLVVFYDAAGTYLGELACSTVAVAASGSVDDFENYNARSKAFFYTPPSASSVVLLVRCAVSGADNDPYCFASMFYLSQAFPNQFYYSPWTDGALGTNTGRFATLNAISAANISTYIEGAAIGTAYIQDAAITNAKIGVAAIGSANIQYAAIATANIQNAAVQTLTLGGNAVTVMSGASGTSSCAIGIYIDSSAADGSPAPVILTGLGSVSVGSSAGEGGDTAGPGYIALLRNTAGGLYGNSCYGIGAMTMPMLYIDYPGIGYHVYTLEASGTGGVGGFVSLTAVLGKR